MLIIKKTFLLTITILFFVSPSYSSSFTSANYATPIDENSGDGQIVYIATAEDSNDISFSLAAGSDSALTINASTGAVTLLDNPDYEAQHQYNFSVIATDAAGNNSEQAVSLQINDLPDYVSIKGIPVGKVGESVIIEIEYDERENNSNGYEPLAFEIHYDSSTINFNAYIDILAKNFMHNGPYFDYDDKDDNINTDKYITFISWNKPVNLDEPVNILRLIFNVANGPNISLTPVNLTVPSTDYPYPVAYEIPIIIDNFDFDKNGKVDALTDGLLNMRYSFGLRGATLMYNAIAEDSPLNPQIIEAILAAAFNKSSKLVKTTSYCNKEVGRFYTYDQPGPIFLSIEQSGSNSITLTASSSTDVIDLFQIIDTNNLASVSDTTITHGIATNTISWSYNMPDLTTFGIRWSDEASPNSRTISGSSWIRTSHELSQTPITVVADNLDNSLGYFQTDNDCSDPLRVTSDYILTTTKYIGAGVTDIDGNGISDALTDSLMLLRYLVDSREEALVENSVALDAIRNTPDDIEQYIANFIPYDISGSNDNSEPVTDAQYLLYPETALNFSASSTAVGFTFAGSDCIVSTTDFSISTDPLNPEADIKIPNHTCEQTSTASDTQSIFVTNIHRTDSQMIVTVGYDSNFETTTGIGFRLHYDSDALSVADVEIPDFIKMYDFMAPSGYQSADLLNTDNDLSTDQKLSFGVGDIFTGQFPYTLDNLATITFDINPAPWPIDENYGAGKIVYKVSAEDFLDIGSDITFGLNGNDASSFTINEQTGEVTLIDNPDYEAQQQYNFSVVATDMAGNSSEKPVTLVVKNLDEIAPVITSTDAAESINESSESGQIIYTVTADDSADISDGFFYGLVANDQPFSIDKQTGEVTLLDNPNYDIQSEYTFTVIAVDAAGNSSEKNISLQINEVDDIPPVFTSFNYAASINENSGDGQIVYMAAAEDSNEISFRLAAGNDSALTINASTGAVTLLDNPDYEAQQQYNFSVIATDLAGNSSQNAVTFTVNNLDEVAPVFTSSEIATINENIGADVVIYTATADDSNDISDGFSFSLAAGSDAALSIDGSTGAVTLLENPDYEEQLSYTFTLIVTDTVGFTDELMVNLNVNNLDEVAPNIYFNSYIASIEENSGAGQVISQCTADDSADISGGVTFSLAEYSYLSINSNSCEVTLLSNPDYESLSVLDYAVIATDAAGNARTHNATLNIINLDDTAPTITSGDIAQSIDENSGYGQVVYTATADDSADVSNGVTFSLVEGSDPALTIHATIGQVVLNNNPDYESQSEYNFTVFATDAAGNSIEQAVVLDVNNLDDVSPIFTSSSYANPMDENSGAGQVIYTAVADDSADISDGVSFTLHGESTIFTIDEANGEVTLTDMPDYEYQAEYIFAVIATDTVNTPVIKHVSLTINNIDDTAPIITSTSTIAIDEASGYEQIVYIATADDSADVSDGVTFSLVSGSDPALTIDVMTGEVVLYNNPDYESQSEYNFTVVATDVAGNSSEQTIVLGVNNLDESAPTITSTAIASAINENSGSGQIVYTATADDSNDISGGVIFNLAEGSDSALTIDAMTGEVVLNNNPDYESQSEYNFTVVATDAAGNVSSPHSVTLSINNLDDAPPIIIPVDPICIDENSGAGQVVYIAAANDSGDISDGVTFSLGHENAELFSIQASTGEVTLLVNPVSGLDYNFTLFATDASGNISPPHSITLCINAIDDPIADLGTQNISVTNSPKGILGRTSVLEVAYDTTDNNSQLSGLGMRVHFDSSLLSFKEITGLIEQDIIIDGLGPYNDEADSDNDPLTDQYIMFGWASLLNNWPNVELPTVLMNIAFDVSNTIDTDAISSTSINFTDSAFTAGYGFNAENYELGLLKATWDLDGNGEADALTDGLMMLRYLFGLRGDAVTNTAIAINSPLSQTEVIAEIEASLDIADIDADGKLNALTDGLLLLRYLFAMRDDSLTYGAIGPYANRTSNEQIEHYIESFLPAM